jgi:hypothetical protein
VELNLHIEAATNFQSKAAVEFLFLLIKVGLKFAY